MGCCGPAVHAEFVEDRSYMGVHGTLTQHQPVGDFSVAQPVGHQPQDVDLSWRSSPMISAEALLPKQPALVCKPYR